MVYAHRHPFFLISRVFQFKDEEVLVGKAE
jgi:hypothetical protein